MASRLAMASKARCCSSSSPLWRHPHGVTTSRSLATSPSHYVHSSHSSVTSARTTSSSLSNRNHIQHHHLLVTNSTQSSKRSLSIKAPTMGHRVMNGNNCSLIAATGPSNRFRQSAAMATGMMLRSAAGSNLATATSLTAKRGFFTNCEQKEVDDVVSFYDDKVTQYANQEIQTVTLKTLLGLGRSGSSSHGDAVAGDLAVNLDVARYARKELPVRLARLIKATQKLPFIVGTNPYIKRVYKLYYDSFQSITASSEEIRDKEDLDRFAALLQGLVASHADVVPMLSQGFLECKKYMAKEDIKRFLDDMIRARIGIRLIAEQAISLREQRHEHDDTQQQSSSTSEISKGDIVGVVHRELRPADLIRTCASFVQELCDVNYGSSPEVVINGQTDTTFTYVPVHLEYILCELLKNSVRATVEQSQKMGRSALNPHGNGPDRRHSASKEGAKSGSGNGVVIVNQDDDQDVTKRPNDFGHPPVEVTIAQGDHEVTIRIRDQGGGISREDFDAIFDYSFTTVKNENEASEGSSSDDSPYGVDSIFKGVSRLAMQAGLGGPIAGLGFGLPLTKIYAQYFGGDMHLVSLQGYGCDVFLKLKQIDETLDDLQI